jgi:uncharacterized membrane protein HdeD (DUF308 family)
VQKQVPVKYHVYRINFVVAALTGNKDNCSFCLVILNMDTRLSCFLWGIIGVIFGLFTLLYPDPELMLATFYGLFLVLSVLGIVVLLLLAMTSRSDESLVLFGFSAVLLIIAVLSFLAREIVGIIFMMIIAGIAFYNGFTDITLALAHPRTKYFLIPGIFLTGAALLVGLLWYFPAFSKNLVLVILGTFAFVFGLFSIFMGYFQTKEHGRGYQAR